jgi:hypothetical protein
MIRPAPHFTTRTDRARRAVRDPFVVRLAILLAGGIVVAPVALLISRTQGHEVVHAGNLPGAAVAIGPGSPSSTTTVTRPAEPIAGTVPPTVVPSGTLPPTIPPATQPRRSTTEAPSMDSGRVSASGQESSSRSASAALGSESGSGSGSSGSTSHGYSTTVPAPTAPAPSMTAPPAPAPSTAPPQQRWDSAAIVQIIRNVFPDDLEAHALFIAYRESRFNPYAHNYCCTGLFQIYGSVHAQLINSLGYSVSQLTDPLVNTIVAYAIYQRSGWAPWGG